MQHNFNVPVNQPTESIHHYCEWLSYTVAMNHHPAHPNNPSTSKSSKDADPVYQHLTVTTGLWKTTGFGFMGVWLFKNFIFDEEWSTKSACGSVHSSFLSWCLANRPIPTGILTQDQVVLNSRISSKMRVSSGMAMPSPPNYLLKILPIILWRPLEEISCICWNLNTSSMSLSSLNTSDCLSSW